jgi:hypothetical protein
MKRQVVANDSEQTPRCKRGGGDFTESKNRLLAIKKEIQKLENLLKPNLS